MKLKIGGLFGVPMLVWLWAAGPAGGSAPAQIDSTAQQATVDAAVQTLFAQTAQPPDMTQTVAAAFSAAQTATAAASTPVPFSVESLQAVDVIELPLLAGPVNTAAYLAPDGERFAYMNGSEVCILDIDTANAYFQSLIAAGTSSEELSGLSSTPEQIAGAECVSLENLGGLNRETIYWSPDGRYLVMTEDFFRTFNDPDLWVLDTHTMTLTDVTDDGETKYPITDTSANLPPADVCPRWLADGRLIFLRYGADQASPFIYTIQPDGSDLRQQGQITLPQRFATYALAVSADNELAYNLWVNGDENSAQNGVWISHLDGSNPRQVWHADQPNTVPYALEWSPDGQYIALNTPDGSYSMRYDATTSFWRAVRVSDGQIELFSPDQFVFSVGWSPEGRAVVYTTGDRLNPDNLGLYLSAEPGDPGRMLIPAASESSGPGVALMGTTPRQAQVIGWATDGTVMVTHGGQPTLLFIRLGAP